ncbi:hypothetical protein EI534_34895, partial [Pseudomonas frederiksbergensis]|nr:hypothetical protein [Pseudomonas frederiksbergensis]
MSARGNDSGSGLAALLLTGTLDSAVRMGFLTFLPFLLQGKVEAMCSQFADFILTDNYKHSPILTQHLDWSKGLI